MNNIDITIDNLQNICSRCENQGTSRCVEPKCRVGFALNLVESMQENKRSVIEDGLKLIPTEDTKNYDAKMIARCVASICKLCLGCKDNHTEQCTISLARKSLEGVFLKEDINYPGSVLSYFVNVLNQDENFANLIKEEITKLN